MYCQKCGLKLNSETNFCPRCGSDLKEKNLAPNQKQQKQFSKKETKQEYSIISRSVFFAIVFVLMLMLFILLFWGADEKDLPIFIVFSVALALIIAFFAVFLYEGDSRKKEKEKKEIKKKQENKIMLQGEQRIGGWALSSLIFGILSLFLLPFVHAAAIICGVIGLKKKQNKTFSVVGIVIGSIVLILVIIGRLSIEF